MICGASRWWSSLVCWRRHGGGGARLLLLLLLLLLLCDPARLLSRTRLLLLLARPVRRLKRTVGSRRVHRVGATTQPPSSSYRGRSGVCTWGVVNLVRGPPVPRGLSPSKGLLGAGRVTAPLGVALSPVAMAPGVGCCCCCCFWR